MEYTTLLVYGSYNILDLNNEKCNLILITFETPFLIDTKEFESYIKAIESFMYQFRAEPFPYMYIEAHTNGSEIHKIARTTKRLKVYSIEQIIDYCNPKYFTY